MAGREQKREGEGQMHEVNKATIDKQAEKILSTYEEIYKSKGNIISETSNANQLVAELRYLAKTGKGPIKKYYKGYSEQNLNDLTDIVEKRLERMKQGPERDVESSRNRPEQIKEVPRYEDEEDNDDDEYGDEETPRPTRERMEDLVKEFSGSSAAKFGLDYKKDKPGIESFASGKGPLPESIPLGWTPDDAKSFLDLMNAKEMKDKLKAEL